MLLGGLWHGAAWHFVIWGGLHGIALALHREWDRLWTGRERLRGMLLVPATLLTFWWANLVFIVFRATDTRGAWSAVRSYVTLHGAGVERLNPALLWITAVLVPLHFLAYRSAGARLSERLPAPLYALIIGGFIAVIAAFVPTDIRPFIYFQF